MVHSLWSLFLGSFILATPQHTAHRTRVWSILTCYQALHFGKISSYLRNSPVHVFTLWCSKILDHSTVHLYTSSSRGIVFFSLLVLNVTTTCWTHVEITRQIMVFQCRKSLHISQLSCVSSRQNKTDRSASELWSCLFEISLYDSKFDYRLRFSTNESKVKSFHYRFCQMQRCWLQRPTYLGRCCI